MAAEAKLHEAIAGHYGRRADERKSARQQSELFVLLTTQNWIKDMLLAPLIPRGGSVLDLQGGKGGDLPKLVRNGAGEIVLLDLAAKSVADAQSRVKSDPGLYRGCDIQFGVADCHAPIRWDRLFPHARRDKAFEFDVVSCQFGLHYSWSSEASALGLLRNVARALKRGGVFVCTIPDATVLVGRLLHSAVSRGSLTFGNRLYSVTFDPRPAPNPAPEPATPDLSLAYSPPRSPSYAPPPRSPSHAPPPRSPSLPSTLPDPMPPLPPLLPALSPPSPPALLSVSPAEQIKHILAPASPFGVRYTFHLGDRVDHLPEFPVPLESRRTFPQLHRAASEQQRRFLSKMLEAGRTGRTFGADEEEVISVYMALEFRKV